MSIVSCNKLVKSFSGTKKEILKSIDLNFEEGSFIGITGRSGSGKSTLLYCLSGLDTITSGEVSIDGKALNAMSSTEINTFRNRQMGFVFQFHYLLPELTAYENILMPARKYRKEDEKKEYASNLMIQFQIEHCYNKRPSQMSGGEMQRTSIARALIMEPKLIFADEPTGNLDSENGSRVMDIFKQVNQELGTTIVMVTHEPDYAARTDRRINLVDGKVESDKFKKTHIQRQK
jgi:ABC-type lipoprotein export system ATPase subunit